MKNYLAILVILGASWFLGGAHGEGDLAETKLATVYFNCSRNASELVNATVHCAPLAGYGDLEQKMWYNCENTTAGKRIPELKMYQPHRRVNSRIFPSPNCSSLQGQVFYQRNSTDNVTTHITVLCPDGAHGSGHCSYLGCGYTCWEQLCPQNCTKTNDTICLAYTSNGTLINVVGLVEADHVRVTSIGNMSRDERTWAGLDEAPPYADPPGASGDEEDYEVDSEDDLEEGYGTVSRKDILAASSSSTVPQPKPTKSKQRPTPKLIFQAEETPKLPQERGCKCGEGKVENMKILVICLSLVMIFLALAFICLVFILALRHSENLGDGLYKIGRELKALLLRNQVEMEVEDLEDEDC